MSRQKRQRRSPRKRGQVRLDCPHCGKSVVVQEMARFQSSVPCPACRIPIDRQFVEAAQAEYEAGHEAEDAEIVEAGNDGEDAAATDADDEAEDTETP